MSRPTTLPSLHRWAQLTAVALVLCVPCLSASPSLGQANDAAVLEQQTTTPAESGPVEPSNTSVRPSDPGLDRLIEILEDEATRSRLLEHLRASTGMAVSDTQSSEKTPAGQTAETEATARPEQPVSVARHLAATTQELAEQVIAPLRRIRFAMTNVGKLFTGETPVHWSRVMSSLQGLLLVVGGTLATHIFTRRVACTLLRMSTRQTRQMGFAGQLSLRFGWSIIDALLIGIAWAIGYGIALNLSDNTTINIRNALFLNAFLASELIAVVLRAVFSARVPALRPVPMGDRTASYWQFWLARIAELLAYGLLLIAPIVSIDLSFPAGRGIRILVVVCAALLAIFVIFRGRMSVRRALEYMAEIIGLAVVSSVLRFMARIWHLVAAIYIVSALVIWLTRPFGAISFVMFATVHSLVAILVATIGFVGLTRFLNHGVPLPTSVRQGLPGLQRRLDNLVPGALGIVRFVLVVGVVLWIADAWDLINVTTWLASDEGNRLSSGFVAAIITIVIALLVHLAAMSWFEYRLNPEMGRSPTPRERTLLTLFQNAFSVILAVVALLLALSEMNVNIAPLLAGAGVLGLAIGFGSQKLVQDIITGAFIQIENAMNEGDVVTIVGISGVVERLTIRSVGLRDLDGVYHLIPFSSVDHVANYMRGFAYHVANISVAYQENIEIVKSLMEVAFNRLHEDDLGGDIIGPLEMHGVTELGDSAVVVRARIKTRPGSQWAIGRAYNERIKAVFDEHGIEIPFPHMTIFWGENKAGRTAPLRVEHARVAKAMASRDTPTPSPPPTTASRSVAPEKPRPRQDGDADD